MSTTTRDKAEVTSISEVTVPDSKRASQQEIGTVWNAIALRTTPGIPPYMHPVVALLTNEAIVAAYPRTEHFKEDIIAVEGLRHPSAGAQRNAGRIQCNLSTLQYRNSESENVF